MLVNDIDCDSFFQFVCLFAFYPKEYIVPILLSMCNLKSNLFILESQVEDFFRTIDQERKVFESFLLLMSPLSGFNEKRYNMKDFSFNLSQSDIIISLLDSLRKEIIEKVIGNAFFCSIMRKKCYYDHSREEKYYYEETCAEFLFRKFFTKRPHPYYYECVFKDNSLDVKKEIVNDIRIKFGYGHRERSTLNTPSATIKEAKSSSNKKSYKASSSFFTKKYSSRIIPM